MSIIRIDSEPVTLDETAGLQNAGVALPGEVNDAGFATLNASFASGLFDPILSGGPGLDNTFAQNAGITINDFITLTDGSQIRVHRRRRRSPSHVRGRLHRYDHRDAG